MATNVSRIQDLVNQNIGDTGTTSVSAADRLRAISQSIKGLYNDFEFDFTNKRYQLNYFDTINYYNITSDVPAMAEPVDVRREEGKHTEPFTRKTPREIAIEIDEGVSENSLAIEQRDRKNYLVLNYVSENTATVMHNCDSTTQAGEISLDTTNSDASTLTFDKGEYKEGTAAINFDLVVAQSSNQRMTVLFNSNSTLDMTKDENISSMIWNVYLPDVTGTSSTIMVGYWGENSSNYWQGTITSDIDGASFADGWNVCKVDWSSATKVGNPNVSKVAWFRIDTNHNSSSDDTDFRIDHIRMVKPERLYFHYNCYYIGVNSTSEATLLTDFWGTSNVPFYSGLYDFFDVYVAHQASAILFRQMGMTVEANNEDALATRELARLRKKFPSSHLTVTKSFKVKGLNLNK